MKNNNKILLFFVVTALFLLNCMTISAADFVPKYKRDTPPIYEDPNYNPYYTWGPNPYPGGLRSNGIHEGNCTWYAFGRAWEAWGTKPDGLIDLGDAGDWYGKTTYPTGTEPRVGSIICLKYPWGDHVAFVEAFDKKTIYTTDSDNEAVLGVTYKEDQYKSYWAQTPIKRDSSTIVGYIYLDELATSACQDPRGYLDAAVGGEGTVRVAGWAIDDDAPDEALEIHVYVGGPSAEEGGEGHRFIWANIQREEEVGKHGFDATFETEKRGNQPVYVYAINATSAGCGNNFLLSSSDATSNPATVNIQEKVITGQCGSNVKYKSEDGKITFSKEDQSQKAIYDSTCTDVFREDPDIIRVIINDEIYAGENANGLFSRAKHIKTMNLKKLNVSGVKSMKGMFSSCTSLKTLNLIGWNTANVTSMESMFLGCESLTTLYRNSWNTSKVTSMENMFTGCKSLTTLDLTDWDTSNVTSMKNMFYSCTSLTDLSSINSWNTAKVTTMHGMFNYCISLTYLDLYEWNTSNVTNMSRMFDSCSSLIYLNFSNWNISNVTNMAAMFYSCNSLLHLNLYNWNTSNVTNTDSMFSGCESLRTLDLGKNTLKKNIFMSLPSYNATWYYMTDNVYAEPIVSRTNGNLFENYDYKTMAGTWTIWPPEMIPGDFNADGVVNISDVILWIRYYAGIDKTLGNPWWYWYSDFAPGDFNGDGRLSISDYALMIRYIQGTDEVLGYPID